MTPGMQKAVVPPAPLSKAQLVQVGHPLPVTVRVRRTNSQDDPQNKMYNSQMMRSPCSPSSLRSNLKRRIAWTRSLQTTSTCKSSCEHHEQPHAPYIYPSTST